MNFTWTSPHGRTLPRICERTLIMGVINVTPDSFSDGGLHPVPEDAANHAFRLASEGADIIDVGGESTRPGHSPISMEDELHRVLPAIAAIRQRCPALPISIDTSKPEVAEAAIIAGADVINDVTGLTGGVPVEALRAASLRVRAGIEAGDLPRSPMAESVAHLDCPVIVMHPATSDRRGNFWTEILADIRVYLTLARNAGVREDQLWIDPGFGFGKTVEENLELLKNLDRLAVLGHPVLLGTSRKSTIGRVLDRPVDQRFEGTAATLVWGIARGCHMVRVHDVAALRSTIRMADAISRGLSYLPST
ncbi:MAG TPA: dihydropteroate synthase family protein [Opitutaceae bacterium]|nr:dihydropteroate synthase family protein [Opitutaceae bacterium]